MESTTANRPAWIGLPLLLLATATLASHRIVSFDIFWHLRAGEEILRTNTLPLVDPFSYTATHRWINHEWLSHVLLAVLYRATGFAGLVAMQALLVTAIVGTMLVIVRPRTTLSYLGLAIFGGLLAIVAEPRAQLLFWLCFAGTLFLCMEELRTPSRKIFWTVPIGILGANLHGGNPTCVVLLGLLFLAAPSRKVGLLVGLGLLATLASPNGYWVHAHFLENRHSLPELREWMPFLQALALPSIPQWSALVLGLIALFAWWRGGNFPRLRANAHARFIVFAFLLFPGVAFRYARFSTERSFLSVLLLAYAHPAQRRPPLQSTIAGPLLASVALATLAWLSPQPLGFGLAKSRFPEEAVAFLKRTTPPGPMFNSYNFGGYLQWAYPDEKVFLDGRAFTVYSEALFRDVIRLYALPSSFRDLERRFGFRLAVLQRHGRGANFLAWLATQPDWRIIYEDALAVVLAKPSP